MYTFALVTEGLTDQIVLENILYGFFDDPDIVINPLQPLRDATDTTRTVTPGNWYKVLEYCASVEFRGAFQFNDYLIIQIDTDVAQDYHVSPNDNEGNELTPVQLIEQVKLAIIAKIGDDFYQQHQDQILFAIAVHSIECWLLPLYCDAGKKGKLKNCLATLNYELGRKMGFTIDPHNKRIKYYERISEDYSERKVLMKNYEANPSLHRFINELQTVPDA